MSEETAVYETREDEDAIPGKLEEAMELVIEETISEWHDGNAADIEVNVTLGRDKATGRDTMTIDSSWLTASEAPAADEDE